LHWEIISVFIRLCIPEDEYLSKPKSLFLEPMARYLTKSRFKLGLECPVKLFYTNKNHEYANKKQEDPFLAALAKGGFQVEELARLEYPEGILIEGDNRDYDALVARTIDLLSRENVVIFEAAFRFNNLFIRTDILVKKSNKIELIEVKAKSFDPANNNLFIGKRGGLEGKWKPYLYDVAFQHYVMSNAFPLWDIRSYIMMADKSKRAEVNGMNQLFRIDRRNMNRTGITVLATRENIGSSVLSRKEISDIVKDIQQNKYKYLEDLNFLQSIELFAEHYDEDKKINYPVSFSACKKCEFKTTGEDDDLKSGYKECWQEQRGWRDEDFSRPTIMEIWDFKSGNTLFRKTGKIFMDELKKEDLKVEAKQGIISASERKWIQVEKAVSGDDEVYMLEKELTEVMQSWIFPLHFIDFETSTVAIPFMKGMRPYEQVAFQFSHHIVHEDGTVEHAGEFISHEAGEFPNFRFVRALKEQLSKDSGSIFRFSNHENSVLNAIRTQLLDSEEDDRLELIEFIESITHSVKDSVVKWCGPRDMVDLWDVYKKYYYDPETKGSNSIKKVLPAMLKRSLFLQEKYSRPIGEIGLSSFNFSGDQVWLELENGEVRDPYKSLPPLLADYDEEFLDEFFNDMEELNNGGAAMTAYSYLQYVDMSKEERDLLVKGLLRYCELDTLAMVMIYEHWRSILKL
jgi:hypothetical protein